jgi:hypothetical protein
MSIDRSAAKMVKSAVVLAMACAVIGSAGRVYALCVFDTTPNLTYLQFGQSPWTSFCNHTISGTGSGGCTATVPANSGPINWSSGNCLTIGSGVTLDLGGITINCDTTNCGAALANTASGSGSAAVSIENGTITGCWNTGIVASAGSNVTVSEMTLDRTSTAGSPCAAGLNAGLHSIRGDIDRVSVSGWLSGIFVYPGKDVNDSSIYNNYVGIDNVGANSSGNDFVNLDLHSNGYAFKNVTAGTYKPTVKSTSIADDSGACNCIDSSLSCVSITSCVDFGSSTSKGDTSFVEGVLFP